MILEWLNNPLTKHYLRYLKEKEAYCVQEATAIVAKAIYSGELSRTPTEIAVFNQIKEFRTTYVDFLNASELASKENLTDNDKVELEDFFKNLIK